MPEIENKELTPKILNTQYVTKNKPVLVKGMAADWPALKKWKRKYFAETVGQYNCWMTTMIHFETADLIEEGGTPEEDELEFSEYNVYPYQDAVPIERAMRSIGKNDETKLPQGNTDDDSDKEQETDHWKPKIRYLDRDTLLAASILRPDYKIPMLNKFLRLQEVALTIWPQFERRPRQQSLDNFVCAIAGREEFSLVSGIFK